jgi:hypothetical protein
MHGFENGVPLGTFLPTAVHVRDRDAEVDDDAGDFEHGGSFGDGAIVDGRIRGGIRIFAHGVVGECVRKGYFELDQLRTAVNPFPLHPLSCSFHSLPFLKGSAYPKPTLVCFSESLIE